MDPLKQPTSQQTQPKNPSSINNRSTLPQALSMQDNKKVCVQICPRDPNATECKCSCN